MALLKLSSPWVVYYRKLNAFFTYDNEVNVVFDEEILSIKIYVNNDKKAVALSQLLPTEKKFGNVTLHITIIPANNALSLSDGIKETLYADAFEGNPVLSYTRTFKGLYNNDMTYIVFKNEVVQFYTDDLGDINGLESTLYELIAEDVFEKIDGVYYCTDVPARLSGVRASYGRPTFEF